MPRFYFNLASKDADIPDNNGKELDTLHDAYAHARKLIDKILLQVGHDDAETWSHLRLGLNVAPLADKAPKCDGNH